MIIGLRLVIAISIVILLTLILAPLQLVSRLLGLDTARKIPLWWHRCVLALCGVRVKVHGIFSDAHPLLLVCNHISWADILVMGSIEQLCFVSKSEVSSWPIINWFAKMQGTVFVDRAKRQDAGQQADTIGTRLLNGDVMVLFAEGTTGDGNNLLDFKSSLLGAAQFAIGRSHIERVMVQPVAIAYTHLHGLPLGRRYQTEASWPGNVRLAPHMINFLLKSAFDINVVLGGPLEFTASSNRKAITKAVNQQVTTMYASAMKNDYSDILNLKENE